MRIFGIDPSYTSTGWALVEDEKVKECGTIKTSKSDGDIYERIHIITSAVGDLIRNLRPDSVAIEDVYVNKKNFKVSIDLAKLNGALATEIRRKAHVVYVYDNRLIKETTTGYGGASKEQVVKMMQMIAGYKGKQEDEADAIAVALTCYRELNNRR